MRAPPDKLKLAFTFSFGLEPPVGPKLQSQPLADIGAAYTENIARLKHMMLAPALVGDF
jgi:hypothetical protein